MGISGWTLARDLRSSALAGWVRDLEPLTTGLLAQDGLKLWVAGDQGALGIRAGAVVYPVFPGPGTPGLDPGIRDILNKIADSWCVMGPAPWVSRTEGLLPPSRVTHRVSYDFLFRPAGPLAVPPGDGNAKTAGTGDADALFPLQEAYEKEEVLFDPKEFQPLASRLHFSRTLKDQVVEALWIEGKPVAKAGTNALTDRWAQLGGVFTKPQVRNRGLQKRLLATLINRLAAQGRGTCLFVKKSNLPALGLYRSLGFDSAGDYTIIYGERRAWGLAFP